MDDQKPPVWPEYTVPLDPAFEWTPIDRNAPIAYVRSILVTHPGGFTQRRWEVVRCPYCGDKHDHSAGELDDDPRRFLGGRQSHCAEGDEYRLVEWTGQTLPSKHEIRARNRDGLRIPLTDREIRSAVWEKSDGRCWYCGSPTNPFGDFAIDHIVPVINGGSNKIENLVPACQSCNFKKGSRPAEYLRRFMADGAFWFEKEGRS